MAEGETSDEQNYMMQIEQAAVWYRLLDELTFRFLRGQRELFSDILADHLALNLALMGSPPDLINETMVARSREYADYREWLADDKKSPTGTLLWEAAKHVGKPIGLNKNAFFIMFFTHAILRKISRASVHELLGVE
jgi:hypothetical protein